MTGRRTKLLLKKLKTKQATTSQLEIIDVTDALIKQRNLKVGIFTEDELAEIKDKFELPRLVEELNRPMTFFPSRDRDTGKLFLYKSDGGLLEEGKDYTSDGYTISFTRSDTMSDNTGSPTKSRRPVKLSHTPLKGSLALSRGASILPPAGHSSTKPITTIQGQLNEAVRSVDRLAELLTRLENILFHTDSDVIDESRNPLTCTKEQADCLSRDLALAVSRLESIIEAVGE